MNNVLKENIIIFILLLFYKSKKLECQEEYEGKIIKIKEQEKR